MTKEPAIYAQMSYPITVTHGCCITVMLSEEEIPSKYLIEFQTNIVLICDQSTNLNPKYSK